MKHAISRTGTGEMGDPTRFTTSRGFGSPVPASNASALTAPDEGGSRGHDFGRIDVSGPARAPAGGGHPLPWGLRSGVETLSGVSLHDVRVHYGSPAPDRLDAAAHARGTEIHVGPGEERHLPHEAWHAAQQKQGRVRSTRHVSGVRVNDDASLEREAEVMGARASAGLPWTAPPVASAPAPAPAAAGGEAVAQLTTKKKKDSASSKATSSKATKNATPKAKDKIQPEKNLLNLLASHAPAVGPGGKKLNRHEKQDAALQHLAAKGTKKEHKQFLEHISGNTPQTQANRNAITKNVRMGGLNETLRTADTPDAAARSMGVVDGVRPSQATLSGGSQNWVDAQRATSGPTENFIFQGTSASASGAGVIQDSHVNALMKEGGKPTVGGTSWGYHNAPDQPSLASNFAASSHVRSFANRNLELHNQLLVTDPQQMLNTPASARAPQTFRTKKGEDLMLNDPDDLEKASGIAAVRGLKEITRQKRYRDGLKAADSESESDVSNLGPEVDSDADSEAEAVKRFGSVKKGTTKTNQAKKAKKAVGATSAKKKGK